MPEMATRTSQFRLTPQNKSGTQMEFCKRLKTKQNDDGYVHAHGNWRSIFQQLFSKNGAAPVAVKRQVEFFRIELLGSLCELVHL